MNELRCLFPRTAVVDAGIAHHLRQTSAVPDAVFCVGTPDLCAEWRSDIAERLKRLSSDEERWWNGCDVGLSSAAMFCVLCTREDLRIQAKNYSRDAAPLDGGDFLRCLNLLDMFPGWRNRLGEIAQAYPNTRWPTVISRWPNLEAAVNANDAKALEGLMANMGGP
jgi:hypothetical protein